MNLGRAQCAGATFALCALLAGCGSASLPHEPDADKEYRDFTYARLRAASFVKLEDAHAGRPQLGYDGHELVSIKCYRIDELGSQARTDILKDLREQAFVRRADTIGPVTYFDPVITVGPWCQYMLGGRTDSWRTEAAH